MKPALLAGSPMFLFKEPRRIPTYMAAIIRRYRFVILATIGFITLMMFSWNFRKKDISQSNWTPISDFKENSKPDIQIFDLNKQYSFDLTKFSNNIDVEQPPFINNIGKLLADEKSFVIDQIMTKKESTPYQVEEPMHLLLIKQKMNEFTTKVMTEIEEKRALMIGDEKIVTVPTLKRPKIKPTFQSMVGKVIDAKHFNSEESLNTITHGDKPVSLSVMRNPEDDFPAPDLDTELVENDVTFPMTGNIAIIHSEKLVSSSLEMLPEQNYLALGQRKEWQKKTVTFPMSKHLTITNGEKPVSSFDAWQPEDFPDLDQNKEWSKNVVTFSLSRNITIYGDKTMSTPTVRQPEQDFPAPDQNKEWSKRVVTLPLLRNVSDTIGKLKVIKHVDSNQQKLTLINSHMTSSGKNSVLLIDTPGCRIPRLDPWDPTVRDLIELQEPYVCPGPPVFMKSNPGGSITFNRTVLETYYNITPEELICYYEPIHRTYEKEESGREISFKFGNVGQLMFGVPLNEDYVSVSCNIKGKKYEQYFPLVRLKKDVEVERNLLVPPNPKLNVILLGIDSVSKLNFLRHFSRTHKFLEQKLKPFEMNGYTKVGDNTFPNLVPLLTGQFVERWWNETVKDTMFFDNIDFIWKAYAMRGYRTFFAEDNPFAGTFNYNKRGFHNPPTDYYFRPMALALEMWKFMSEPEKEFCLNSQLDYDMIYDYLKVFEQTMDTRPYFGFAMLSTITHDKLNNAGWADEPTERFLDGLLNTGALNNTMLVLFSDHGLRFGKIRHTYVGKFEERLPFMYIYFPKWFLDQNPEIAKNMKINQNRLMTAFDVHATMLHMLDLKTTQDHRSIFTLGRSLFEEISENRTCPDAYIQTHWCPCQTFDIVDLDRAEVINASHFMVHDINSKLEPYSGICEILEVDTVLDARVGKANELMLQYLRTENDVINKTVYIGDEITPLDDYMITLVTKPGAAVFEGTIRHNPENNSYSVLGLSRISMYGNTSWCIDSPKMKTICYCIQQLS